MSAPRRGGWDGAVALVLAACVGVAYAVALVVAVLDPERLPAQAGVLLYVTGGALIGAVVTWLGGGPRGRKDDDDGQ